MEPQLVVVLAILGFTVFLIVTELIRIDLVALVAMLSLTWTGSITATEARSGFSSNAVMAIIGVMILGRGLFKSGVTDKLANFILRVAGKGKRRILATISGTVGVMSGFMQNIGAAALFLPVMMGISKREKIPVSGLLMPMGFSALLGGTLTMVGTSSLIVLNDLLSNRGLATFDLFAVTPIGVVLLLVGIAFFTLFGDAIFPSVTKDEAPEASAGQKLLNVWGLADSIYTLELPAGCSLVGKTIKQSRMGSDYGLNLMRIYDEEGEDRTLWDEVEFEENEKIVVQGHQEEVEEFARDFGLRLIEEEDKAPQDSKRGYVEVVIPARSSLVGKSIREVSLRETYHAQVVLFFSDSQVVEHGVADRIVQAGDTLVLHGKWENLQYFKESEDFITVSPFKYQQKKPEKASYAVASFVGAIAVVFLTNLPISMGFLTGAVFMILTDVLNIEDAYRAIEWKVIFLISGLIPIGIAMEKSGAAAFIAESLVVTIQGLHPFVILLVLGALTTAFSLFMSNVAATVLLVPLVIEMAGAVGLSSQALVLQVGVCAANSFIIPTHHVNALLMTPGGYQVSDYLRAGSLLSVIFLLVSSAMIYFVYL